MVEVCDQCGKPVDQEEGLVVTNRYTAEEHIFCGELCMKEWYV